MERVYYFAKYHITHFKLDFCCWFAPVRVGLMIVGYTNIIIDLICMMGIANEGLAPTITKVQDILISDFVSKPIPILAYAIEMGFNVVLLCGVYRRDIILLRVFLYYTVLAIIMSIMTYSIVIAAVPFHIQLAIVASVLFQTYCILLVRSVIVELKMENKKYELPRLVMSSLLKDKETPCIYDPNNGKIQEVTITEMPKKQEVQVTVIGKDEQEPDTKVVEIRKVPEKQRDTNTRGAELQKDTVKVQIEKPIDDHKKKADERKLEKMIQDERKKEEKKAKEEQKKEEKKLKEEKKKEEKKMKEEKKKDDKKITSMILKKYKDDKEAEGASKSSEEKNEFKEIPLQSVSGRKEVNM